MVSDSTSRTQAFYDGLAPYFHLLYADWEASVARQARGLAAVLQEFGVPIGSSILDAACGIGTQTIGLAQLGYHVTASDPSPAALARARAEVAARDLTVSFAISDLRRLSEDFDDPFAAVLACDNVIPHLLSDAEILTAFAECRRVLMPAGVLIISLRDYAQIERRTPDYRPYRSHTDGEREYSAAQTWTWDGDQYDLTLRLTEKCGAAEPVVRELVSRYYAVELPTIERLLRETGFAAVARRDEHFFQPLVVAINSQ